MANTNEYLVYGWNVQQLGNTASQTGYAQPATVPTVAQLSAALQATSGNGYSPTIGAYGSNEVLTNPGYADGQTLLGAVGAPGVTGVTSGIQSPYGLACQVTVTGTSVTSIQVAPDSGGSAGVYTTVGGSAASGPVTVQVPAAGFIKTVGANPTSWVWVTFN